ncbi:purine/pyrimidine permease [Paenibacillus validus]|uniref:Xanthine permease n=1 Tax=Paenibacillus validus TaxID=44253 RepID=A0A7X3CTK1_9BACL|nr:purine/pyrimidine permease [Paenibacillus validus]MED4600822.1 purine/pyrimidine permease [Paenibacillus validus]MED4608065.1 purine/pyrimidine permease [Paenibacillus validus]MUG71831.1 xanthine permease [Paenibacillus validus]
MKNGSWGTAMASIQWFMFLLAGSIAFPIIIGHAYQLPADEISGFMQRTFLVVGVSTLLGGWLGHRLPIVDGPAGIWVGVFVLMGQMAFLNQQDPMENLRLLEGSMLLAGTILAVLGAAGWMEKMLKLFTPLVNGVYLIILTFQLSGAMLKGMIGFSGTSTPIEPGNVAVSFSVFLLVLALSIWGKSWMKSYAVLTGMIAGWVVFVLVNGGESMPRATALVSLPDLFAWGLPRLDAGTFISSVMVSLVLVSSVIVSVSSMRQVLSEREQMTGQPVGREGRLEKGGLISGVSTILASVFSTIATVPFSVSSGFVRTTGQTRMLPFFIACLAFAAASFFPFVYAFLSTLPEPVANAAMLALFSQMVGIGISSVLKETLDQRRLTILGLSLTLGTGVMFLPQAVFSGLPTVLQYIMSNGVLVGILTALLLEQTWLPKQAPVSEGIRP